jgi:site-specific recombinase XerD
MAKVTPVLWNHKENAEGRSPIYLRISVGQQTKYKSLRVYVKETHWNKRQRRVRKSQKRHGEINALIQQKLSEAETLILDRKRSSDPVSARFIKEGLAENPSSPQGDYFAYADKDILSFEKRDKIYTHKRYKTCIKKFRKFTGEPLPFEEITPQLLREYQTHLAEHYGNKQTTIAANFSAIRAILYRAMRDGLADHIDNPFFHFKIKNGTPQRDKLSKKQFQRVEELDLKEESLIWHVRNYFCFSTYCAGIRFGDLAKMKRHHIVDGRLNYHMSKTSREKSIKLMASAKQILTYYYPPEARGQKLESRLFPMLENYDIETERDEVNAIAAQNALVNKYLKKIARRAKISASLSSHVARHTFATMALRQGWDVAEISNALGHSGLKVTENYLAGFDDSDLDDKMSDLFS